MKNWLHEIYSITSKLRLYIIAIFIAGICSMIIGAFLSYTHTAPTWVQAQFNPAGAIVEANSLSTSGFIFSILGRNIFLSGIFIFTSPLQLGILDLISFLGTLFQMGGQIIWFNEGKNRLLLNGLGVFIPHAIFEVPAVILTTAISLKIGRTMIKPETSRRDALKKRFQEAIKLFPLIVVLLVIAAVTEGEVSLPRATAAVEKTLLNQATKTVSDDAEQWVIQVPIDWQQEDWADLKAAPMLSGSFQKPSL